MQHTFKMWATRFKKFHFRKSNKKGNICLIIALCLIIWYSSDEKRKLALAGDSGLWFIVLLWYPFPLQIFCSHCTFLLRSWDGGENRNMGKGRGEEDSLRTSRVRTWRLFAEFGEHFLPGSCWAKRRESATNKDCITTHLEECRQHNGSLFSGDFLLFLLSCNTFLEANRGYLVRRPICTLLTLGDRRLGIVCTRTTAPPCICRLCLSSFSQNSSKARASNQSLNVPLPFLQPWRELIYEYAYLCNKHVRRVTKKKQIQFAILL